MYVLCQKFFCESVGMLNTPDTATILSPTGTLLDPNLILSGVNGTNTSPGYVSRAVPGVLLASHGIGQFSVAHSGLRGTLTAEVVTGTAGSARGLVSVRSALTSAPYEVRLALDNQNRPTAFVVVAGVSIAVWTPVVAAVAAGVPYQLRLVWDSLNPLPSGNYVDFTAYDGSVPGGGSWTTLPSAPFVMAPMSFALLGSGAPSSDFNGTVRSFQVGERT
jgi:hypothetical protein